MHSTRVDLAKFTYISHASEACALVKSVCERMHCVAKLRSVRSYKDVSGPIIIYSPERTEDYTQSGSF